MDCDSHSAIFLEKNPPYHSNTKHIDVQYHFVKDMAESKKVLLEKVDTLDNVVDSLTKSMSTEKFSWCREAMGTFAEDFFWIKTLCRLYAKNTMSGRMLGMCYIVCRFE